MEKAPGVVRTGPSFPGGDTGVQRGATASSGPDSPSGQGLDGECALRRSPFSSAPRVGGPAAWRPHLHSPAQRAPGPWDNGA